MQRIPEPDLMDDATQALAYAQADFAEPHQHFVTLITETFPSQTFAGWVLDLGCGPADISIRFARQNSAAQIHGIDGAEQMLMLGSDAIAKAGLDQRIELMKRYLPDDALPRQQYDAIISNSLLHHLQDPMVLWQTIKHYAANGAPIFVMDLMRPQDEQQAKQFVDLYADGEADILRHDFYQSLLAAYTVDEVRQQLDETGLAYLQVKAVSDRHLTVSGFYQ